MQTCTRLCVCVCVCACVCVHAHAHARMHACVCVCKHTQECIYFGYLYKPCLFNSTSHSLSIRDSQLIDLLRFPTGASTGNSGKEDIVHSVPFKLHRPMVHACWESIHRKSHIVSTILQKAVRKAAMKVTPF